MRYRTIVHVGVYWEGFDMELSPSMFFWTAWLKAKWHLFWNPYRMASIKPVKYPRVLTTEESEAWAEQERTNNHEESSNHPSDSSLDSIGGLH